MKKKKTVKGNRYCSPSVKKRKTGSCYSDKNLIEMVDHYNKGTKDSKDKIKTKKKSKLWHSIDSKMSNVCDTEWCWNFKLLRIPNIFKPKKPVKWKKNPRDWLDSNNIINVMKQYENTYNDFVFIGPVPIDFDLQNDNVCLIHSLCNINITKLINRKKTRLGIIFNLDTHDGPGSHWTALYLDTRRKQICYFDSYGNFPEKSINTLMIKLEDQYKQNNIKMKRRFNNIRHQYKNSECGMYCLHFIITMLTTKKTFSKFCKEKMPDDKIFLYRDKYYI